jgi:hypothetical protein
MNSRPLLALVEAHLWRRLAEPMTGCRASPKSLTGVRQTRGALQQHPESALATASLSPEEMQVVAFTQCGTELRSWLLAEVS